MITSGGEEKGAPAFASDGRHVAGGNDSENS